MKNVRRRMIDRMLWSVLAFAGAAGAAVPAAAEVTATDVVDDPSLREFVERARNLTEAETLTDRDAAYAYLDGMFRGDVWAGGPIYLFVITTDGDVFFHAGNAALEGRNLWDNEDRNGVRTTQELIAAAERGGDFVDYYFDNPDIEGDEEEGSPKRSYALPLTLAGERYVIGSGYYLPNVPVAPPFALGVLAVLLAGLGYLRRREPLRFRRFR